jgi:NADH-quinone oxidoreductase subunit N
VALVRIVGVAMPGMEQFGWRVALVLAVLTMTLGNALALWQNNLRRLMAYSSIAHGGYMLIGLAALLAVGGDPAVSLSGAAAVMLYLGLYTVAALGAFAVFVQLAGSRGGVESVDDLAGLATSRPRAALAMALFMFSLAGIPPLAGFWGKFALFTSALDVDAAAPELSGMRLWFIVLAVAGGLNAAVAAAYYLRIVAVMYFGAGSATRRDEPRRAAGFASGICVALVVLLGLLPGPIARFASSAAASVSSDPGVAAQADDLSSIRRSRDGARY